MPAARAFVFGGIEEVTETLDNIKEVEEVDVLTLC